MTAKPSTLIMDTLLSWPDVTAHPHRFGGMEFRLGRREIGHIHGDYLVDIPFPTQIRNELVAAGQAWAHHLLPDSGWVSYYIEQPEDVDQAIALLRRSYEVALEQIRLRQRVSGSPDKV